MAIRPLTPTERFAIDDLLRAYVYCNDTHDVDGMVALFAKDAVLQQGTRGRWEGREGVRKWITDHGALPGRAGRQHRFQQVQIKRTKKGCKVRSYWMVVQSVVATDSRFVRQIGYYDDELVKVRGKWLIKHKYIGTWNDETPPPQKL
jgi:hypothetical protein